MLSGFERSGCLEHELHEDGSAHRSQQGDWHGDDTDFEEVPEAHVELLLAECKQPQDDSKRARDREVGAEVYTDQYGMGDQALNVRSLQDSTCNEAEWKIIDQVIGYTHNEAGDQSIQGRCEAFPRDRGDQSPARR